MEEKKEEDLKEKLELLNKLFLPSSSLALIIGGSWFLIYLVFIVKDFPLSIEKSIFYYIFAIFICLIIFIVYPLMSYLHIKIIEENNLERENKIVNKIGKFFLKLFYLFSYTSVNFILLLYLVYVILIKGYFFIFPINSACEMFSKVFICKVFICLVAIIIFLMLQVFLYNSLKDSLKRIIIYRDNNAFISIILILASVIIIYAGFFLTAPFYILKLGYFEANLTLDKEYVDKTELKTYLENCQPECLDESSNDNYCKFFITCLEKCQTECLNELFKDTQNDNHCRTFKFFVFLRTSSEYIVGCSENSNVRIHIPSDKVIAIEY
jgi:hypothetical protein